MSANEPATFRTSRAAAAPTLVRGMADGEDTVVELKRAAGAEAAVPLLLEQLLDTTEVPEEAPTAPVQAEAPAMRIQLPSVTVLERPLGRLFLVSRSRGGLGATSFAVNLALALKGAGKGNRKVAILDLDLQFGTVGSCLDMPDRGGLLGLAMLEEEPDAHAVSAAAQTHGSGLTVLPAPKKPIPLDAFDTTRMDTVIRLLLQAHDDVVVDMPPALVSWMEPLLRNATRLFMVTDLSVPSVDCARRVVDTFREDAPDLKVEIIVAGEKKPLFRSKIHREVGEALSSPLTHWLPLDPKRARQALDRGEPLMSMAPMSAWSRSIKKIVGQLA